MRNIVTREVRVVSEQPMGTVGTPTMSLDGTSVAFGASSQLDARFASSGLFVRFTELGRSWFWIA